MGRLALLVLERPGTNTALAANLPDTQHNNLFILDRKCFAGKKLNGEQFSWSWSNFLRPARNQARCAGAPSRGGDAKLCSAAQVAPLVQVNCSLA